MTASDLEHLEHIRLRPQVLKISKLSWTCPASEKMKVALSRSVQHEGALYMHIMDQMGSDHTQCGLDGLWLVLSIYITG